MIQTEGHLHLWAFYIFCIVSIVVFFVFIGALIRRIRFSATQEKSLGLEILWMVVPFVLLALMAIPAAQLLFKNRSIQANDSFVETRFPLNPRGQAQ